MLEQFLVSQVFAFLIIFCRIGGGIMVLPGFGEAYVPPQMRLAIAFMISLLLMPVLSHKLPAMPSSPLALTLLACCEILTGIMIGAVCNILLAATNIAGTIISTQAGLSSVLIFDVTQNNQGTLVGNFVGLIALVLVFTTNLHHLMIAGITQSYTAFVPGHFVPTGDFASAVAHIVTDIFRVALEISSPLIVAGTMLYLGAGLLSRLAPTMQVFFVVLPAQILLMLFILASCFSGIMMWYMDFYHDELVAFMGYARK